jgi:hypothetical protein
LAVPPRSLCGTNVQVACLVLSHAWGTVSPIDRRVRAACGQLCVVCSTHFIFCVVDSLLGRGCSGWHRPRSRAPRAWSTALSRSSFLTSRLVFLGLSAMVACLPSASDAQPCDVHKQATAFECEEEARGIDGSLYRSSRSSNLAVTSSSLSCRKRDTVPLHCVLLARTCVLNLLMRVGMRALRCVPLLQVWACVLYDVFPCC